MTERTYADRTDSVDTKVEILRQALRPLLRLHLQLLLEVRLPYEEGAVPCACHVRGGTI